jgi:hypothetical protein
LAAAHGYKLCGLIRAPHHRGYPETPDRAEWVDEIQLAVNQPDSFGQAPGRVSAIPAEKEEGVAIMVK